MGVISLLSRKKTKNGFSLSALRVCCIHRLDNIARDRLIDLLHSLMIHWILREFLSRFLGTTLVLLSHRSRLHALPPTRQRGIRIRSPPTVQIMAPEITELRLSAGMHHTPDSHDAPRASCFTWIADGTTPPPASCMLGLRRRRCLPWHGEVFPVIVY